MGGNKHQSKLLKFHMLLYWVEPYSLKKKADGNLNIKVQGYVCQFRVFTV